MKKLNLGAAHTGFHDWYWQRVSAVCLLIGIPILLILLLATYNGNIPFNTLNQWLTHPVAKSFSIVFLLALFMHIWTGLKVIIEDYVHTAFGRLIVLNVLLIVLLGFGFYMIYHIWAEFSYSFSCLPCGLR